MFREVTYAVTGTTVRAPRDGQRRADPPPYHHQPQSARLPRPALPARRKGTAGDFA
jgi:hypothetical protein